MGFTLEWHSASANNDYTCIQLFFTDMLSFKTPLAYVFVEESTDYVAEHAKEYLDFLTKYIGEQTKIVGVIK